MGNGFCTYSSEEMVLLRLHLQSCAPILSLLSKLAYITLTGSAEVTFSGVKKQEAWSLALEMRQCALSFKYIQTS